MILARAWARSRAWPAGLAAIASRAEITFVSATDLPFLDPAFVRRVLRAAQEGRMSGCPWRGVIRSRWRPPIARRWRQ